MSHISNRAETAMAGNRLAERLRQAKPLLIALICYGLMLQGFLTSIAPELRLGNAITDNTFAPTCLSMDEKGTTPVPIAATHGATCCILCQVNMLPMLAWFHGTAFAFQNHHIKRHWSVVENSRSRAPPITISPQQPRAPPAFIL